MLIRWRLESCALGWKKPMSCMTRRVSSAKNSSGSLQFCRESQAMRMPSSRSTRRMPSGSLVVSKANSSQPEKGISPPGTRVLSASRPSACSIPGSAQKVAP